MGEGGGREDADKIKSIKWKGFSRAFLSGESKAATTSAMGLPGFWGRGDAGLGSSIPRSRVKWEEPPCSAWGLSDQVQVTQRS